MECLLEETGWASSAAGIKVAKGGHSVSGVNLAISKFTFPFLPYSPLSSFLSFGHVLGVNCMYH